MFDYNYIVDISDVARNDWVSETYRSFTVLMRWAVRGNLIH